MFSEFKQNSNDSGKFNGRISDEFGESYEKKLFIFCYSGWKLVNSAWKLKTRATNSKIARDISYSPIWNGQNGRKACWLAVFPYNVTNREFSERLAEKPCQLGRSKLTRPCFCTMDVIVIKKERHSIRIIIPHNTGQCNQ